MTRRDCTAWFATPTTARVSSGRIECAVLGAHTQHGGLAVDDAGNSLGLVTWRDSNPGARRG